MDFSDWAGINRIDRDAISAMLGALEGTEKPFVGTTGTLLVAQPGKVAVETDVPPASTPLTVRHEAERLVIDAARRGVRASVVRLAPTVHGAGDKGFVPMLINLARQKGAAAYVGDGGQHWPAVHREDAARLYRLAVERAPAGAVLHGAAEEGVTQRAIAETIAAATGVPTKSLPAAEAAHHFGFMAMVVDLDNRTSSRATRELLGWRPEQPGLLEDMRAHYFFWAPGRLGARSPAGNAGTERSDPREPKLEARGRSGWLGLAASQVGGQRASRENEICVPLPAPMPSVSSPTSLCVATFAALAADALAVLLSRTLSGREALISGVRQPRSFTREPQKTPGIGASAFGRW